jgi:N-acetylmuramic acid 6-phosphate etherase
VIVTESHDAALADLDLRPTVEVGRALNAANAQVLTALGGGEEALAALVDAAAARSGRVVYVGAGSAGLMAAADASEWAPTFSVPDDAVVALVAGAQLAPGPAWEVAEDDAAAGAAELRALEPGPEDVVVGVSASGSTPYARGAFEAAGAALTAAVVCVPGSALTALAAAGCDEHRARAAIAAAGDDLEVARAMLLAGLEARAARERLRAAGNVREAAR